MNNIVIFDLDDTLYKEVEFLKSGFRYIINRLSFSNRETILNEMLQKYQNGVDVFAYLQLLRPNLKKNILLDWYRYHIPDISMRDETVCCLEHLKNKGTILGLITDGRSITQRNKIKALGLSDFIDNRNIIISEEFGSEKPSDANYKYFTNTYPACRHIYIGDNPQKDFVTPNKLGWLTFGVRDNGENIHPQMCNGAIYEPKVWINNIIEIKEYL